MAEMNMSPADERKSAEEQYKQGLAALNSYLRRRRTVGLANPKQEKQDLETAWTCLRSAAEQGCAPAMERLGYMYETVESKTRSAEEWYRKGMSAGCEEAAEALFLLQAPGERDPELRRWFDALDVKKKDALMDRVLGRLRDDSSRAAWLEEWGSFNRSKLADAGDAYREAGRAKDALRCWEAAKENSVTACIRLGDLCLKAGDGAGAFAHYSRFFQEPEGDFPLVLELLLRVAVCRYFGLGTEQDRPGAEKLMDWAVYVRHCAALADIYMKMVGRRYTLEEAEAEFAREDNYSTWDFEYAQKKEQKYARTDTGMLWGKAFVVGDTREKTLYTNSSECNRWIRCCPEGAYKLFTQNLAFEGCLIIREMKDRQAGRNVKAGFCREGGKGRDYYREGRYADGRQEGLWSVYYDDGRIFRVVFKNGKPAGKAVLEKDGALIWKGSAEDFAGLDEALQKAGLDPAAAGKEKLLDAVKNSDPSIGIYFDVKKV